MMMAANGWVICYRLHPGYWNGDMPDRSRPAILVSSPGALAMSHAGVLPCALVGKRQLIVWSNSR